MTQPVYVRKSHLLEQEVFILMMMIIPFVSNLKVLRVNVKAKGKSNKEEWE